MFTYLQSHSSTEGEAAASSLLLQRRALEQLRDALASMPPQQQTAYREALAICPSLVEAESDPLQFLLYTDFNAWKAATRLVTYWEKRKEVFGERAFRPVLDLSGNGALTPEDVKLILTGSFMLTAEDTVVVDRSLEPENAKFSIESQIRHIFFFQQLLSRHRVNATPGKGCKFVVRYKRFKTTERRVAAKTSEICSQAIPIRIKAVHLVFAADFQPGFMQNAVSFLFKLWGIGSNLFVLHHCQTPEQALLKLIPHGVLPSALPPSFGGSYEPDAEFLRFVTQLGALMRSHGESDHGKNKDSFFMEECDQVNDSASLDNTPSTRSYADPLNLSTLDDKPNNSVRKLKSLSEAIDLLPDNDKAAYIQALRVAPGLVEEESPPLLFLEFEAFDAWSAENRLEVFEDRAFLPMTVDGAMGPDGEKALETGMHYLLREDKFGRSVWCAEPLLKMSSDPEIDFKMRVKALYYTLSKMLKNPNSTRDGSVGVLMVCQIEIPFLDSRCPSGWNIFTEFCYKFLLRLYTSLYGEPQNIHFCVNAEAQEQLYQKFEEIGIAKEGLPNKVGGQDGPSEFLSRQRLEESRSASPSTAIAVSESAIKDMQTALSLIPNEKKTAYLEALSKAPELAKQETLWKNYLRFTGCDATKAASIFALYWEVRKELFGNRAFLPVNQTFEGALERKDVAVLQTGYFMQLPCVESGESVLYCDGTKLQKSSSSLSRARCKFYLLSIMAENPIAQTRGFNLLYFSSDPSFDRVFKDHFFERLLPVMPVRVNHVHLLGLDLNSTSGKNQDNSIGTRVNETKSIFDFRRTASSSVVESHVGISREDLYKGLFRHGFKKQGLPKALFGDLGYDDFVKWQELRVRYEWGLFTNSRELEISSRYLIPRNKLIVHEEDSEKVERKRRMTIILSRRKRERERMSMEGMQEEAMEQTERHRKLQRQNETLQELLDQAKEIAKRESS